MLTGLFSPKYKSPVSTITMLEWIKKKYDKEPYWLRWVLDMIVHILYCIDFFIFDGMICIKV